MLSIRKIKRDVNNEIHGGTLNYFKWLGGLTANSRGRFNSNSIASSLPNSHNEIKMISSAVVDRLVKL